MERTDTSGLTQLGQSVAAPTSPEEAVLERVPASHPGTDYTVRFTAPEFTSLCPLTGQPDFAHIVIDYIPGDWLVESKSLKLYLASFRNHGVFHETCSVEIALSWWSCSRRNGYASGPIGIRAGAFRLMSFGKPGRRPKVFGSPIRVWPPIAGAVEKA
ncbi:7-cyano-7-deazaguanine reductase [Rhodobacter aestuarii]|uniref:NADPH-dependent 7-cyano-7-deazaguanine reductase n=1 Tax=Rhodobacter aestuarii TaxID=453582 RepID=A0A1N7PCB2_9RHOB|nr:7-cyano-7-deazaguanine reductase [Rhodobacter aestuarii]SIT08221.1 7-cyano-7-deazaguanine reductase [Rhodobacter aestuarii]